MTESLVVNPKSPNNAIKMEKEMKTWQTKILWNLLGVTDDKD